MTGSDGKAEKKLLDLKTWKMWYVMIVLYMLYFFDFATRTVISPMFPLIKKDLGLSDAQLGWLSTVVLATVGLLAIPLSYFVDRWRRGKMISIMAIVWSAATFFSGISANIAQLFTARACLGVGEASFAPGGQAMIMAIINKARRTTITGIWTTGSSLGAGIGMILGGWIGVHYGWRTAFMVMAIPGVIFGILAWFFPDYKNKPKTSNGAADPATVGFGRTMLSLLKNKTVVLICISFGIMYYFVNTILYWLPSFLNRYMGMDIVKAGKMSGVVLFITIIASPLGGWLADLVSKKNSSNKLLVVWICVILAVCSWFCAIVFSIWPVFFIVWLFCTMFIPIQQTALQEVVPVYQRATAYGMFMFGMFFLGGLWGPAVTGMISDAHNLRVAFYVNGAVGLVGVFTYLAAWRFSIADYPRARRLEAEFIEYEAAPA